MRLPDRFEQLGAALDAPFALDQGAQQLELGRREVDLRRVYRHPVRAAVQCDPPGRDDAPGGDGRRRQAAQHRADAQDELLRGERFREIVVGAEREALDAVRLILARREQDDAQVLRFLAATQLGEHVVARDAGQHQIEHDQVGPLLPRRAQRVAPVRRRDHPVAGLGEVVGDERRDVGLVVDHEDAVALRLGHRSRAR